MTRSLTPALRALLLGTALMTSTAALARDTQGDRPQAGQRDQVRTPTDRRDDARGPSDRRDDARDRDRGRGDRRDDARDRDRGRDDRRGHGHTRSNHDHGRPVLTPSRPQQPVRASTARAQRPIAYGPTPVSPAELDQLVYALQQATFSRDQLALLGDMLPSRHFTVGQAMALVQVLTFESYQVDAAVMLYPHIVDPGEWYRMYGMFSFSSSQRDLRARTTG